MKKIILLAGLLLSGVVAQAQIISLESNDGEGNNIVVENDDVIVFDELASQQFPENGKMHFSIQNVSAAPVNLKLKMIDIENGTNMEAGQIQFCFGGLCYDSVSEGITAPANTTGITLAPNAINNEGYLQNAYAGDTGTGLTYTIAFIQVDGSGNQIGNNLITFQYKYQPTAGLNDFTALQNIGITVDNTVVKNNLNIQSNLEATVSLFDINGKLVKTAKITNGNQAIDMSAFNTGIYIARFTTQENKSSQIRIVKN